MRKTIKSLNFSLRKFPSLRLSSPSMRNNAEVLSEEAQANQQLQFDFKDQNLIFKTRIQFIRNKSMAPKFKVRTANPQKLAIKAFIQINLKTIAEK